MSRTYNDEYEESFPNEGAFWERRAQLALNGKRGRQALADLRDALLALPEKRLISRAFSTVGKADQPDRWGDLRGLLDDQGEGVCAVGAYVWHQKVKAGADPLQAMAELPLLADYDSDGTETAEQGKAAGLTFTLAWELASRNDDTFDDLTPEARYDAFLAWIDAKLAQPAGVP